MSILRIENLSFSYKDRLVLDEVSLYVNAGEIVCILGGSGAGKSTLFNLIAGVLKSDADIFIQEKERLKIGYMQQNDLLLGHFSVLKNVALPMIINKIDSPYEKAYELLKSFGLENLADKYPKSLSGGQKQRIAFLRTISLKATLYLLDEPFNSLDFLTKNEIYKWLKNIQKEQNLPILLITHDIDEAIVLSDRIYVLHNGRIFKHIKNVNQDSKAEILSTMQKIV